MAEEANPLREAKFGGGLYLNEFPAKIRVLTRDPMVYVDKYANTKYVFAVLNVSENKVQMLDKGPGFVQRFQEIDMDEDFGGDIRKIDLKITTNGKDGTIEVRYTITPIGSPSDLTKEQLKVIKEEAFDLAEKVKKNNPNALRQSEINSGAKVKPMEDEELTPSEPPEDVIITDITDGEPVSLDDIPF